MTNEQIKALVIDEMVEPLPDDSPRKILFEIGNQVHNIATEWQRDEDLSSRLANLRDRIWAAAREAAAALRTMQAEPVRYLYDFTDFVTGDVTEGVSKIDRSGEPRVSNVRPLYATPAASVASVAERCAAIADDLASDELFLDEKGRFGAELVAASIRDEFDLADATAKSQAARLAAPPAPAGLVVKGLIWKKSAIDEDVHRAESPIGVYTVEDWRHNRFLVHNPHGGTIGEFNTLEAAKAAAQADYERRVLAALSDAPAREGWHSKAADDVLAERRRQVEAEGWTPEHDDQHDRGEMAEAAGVYALAAASHEYGCVLRGSPVNDYLASAMKLWPWSRAWFKPKDRRRDLVRAGALILAEIERRDRLPAASPTGEDV